MEKGHSTYFNGDQLIVEWYDFGENAPYESANMLILSTSELPKLAGLFEIEDWSPEKLAAEIRERFATKWEVQRWAEEHDLACRRETDFMP